MSAYLGVETETEGRVDGDKHLVGMRTGAQWACAESCDAYANIGLQYGKYQSNNLLFEVRREDVQYDAKLGVNFRFAKHWSFRPQLVFVRTDSNVIIHDYKRYDVTVSLRRDF